MHMRAGVWIAPEALIAIGRDAKENELPEQFEVVGERGYRRRHCRIAEAIILTCRICLAGVFNV
jgi:hypothetical protein